jgi:hypothetical protein
MPKPFPKLGPATGCAPDARDFAAPQGRGLANCGRDQAPLLAKAHRMLPVAASGVVYEQDMS